MKRKRFFNKDKSHAASNIRQAYAEIKNEFQPVATGFRKLFKKCVTRHPKKMLVIMLLLPLFNFLALYFFTDAFKTKKGLQLSDIHFSETGIDTEQALPQIAFSFANLKKIRELKDTLQYLMSLKKMSFNDTLIFVRVMDEFSALTAGKDKSIPTITLEQLRTASIQPTDSIFKKQQNSYHEN